MAICAYCKTEETQLYVSGIPICLKCSGEGDNSVGKEPPTRHKSAQTILIDNIEDARARVDEANKIFMDVMGQVPSGVPHPDGSQRIQNASRKLAIARHELMTAHQRFDDFLKTGMVPEDLKRGES
jgi:hypothetical protein